MNKNFVLMTSLPEIPLPPDFDNREDLLYWTNYQMKEVNLLLDAYINGKLFFSKYDMSNYFREMRDLLVNLMKTPINGNLWNGISKDILQERRESFEKMSSIVERINGTQV
jgi:hypothetical protein